MSALPPEAVVQTIRVRTSASDPKQTLNKYKQGNIQGRQTVVQYRGLFGLTLLSFHDETQVPFQIGCSLSRKFLEMLKQVTFIILICAATCTHADGIFEWTSSNFQVLHGSGFKLGANDRSTITIEHANGWRYGDNFMFIDFIQRDDVGLEVYGEWYSRLSLSRLSNKNLSFGVFRDFFVVGGLNASTEPEGDSFKAYLLGMGTSFNIRGSGVINLNVMAQKHDQVNSTGIQITPSWSIPFELRGLKFRFDGFLDWVSTDSSGGKPFILAQPQLLFDVGHLVGNSESIYVGIEYYYWRNKFGIEGIHDKAVQGMLKIIF